MTTLVIHPSGEPEIVEVSGDVKDLQELVDGSIEVCSPMALPHGFRIVVNEDFLAQRLPYNPFASYLYGTPYHGQVICGDCVIMREAVNEYGEHDLVGLSALDVGTVLNVYKLNM